MRSDKTRARPTQITAGKHVVDGAHIGNILRERRLSLGISLAELSAASGVGVSSAHALEHGNLNIRLETFLHILASLCLSPTDVLADADGKPIPHPAPTFESELRARASANLPELLGLVAHVAAAVDRKPAPPRRKKRAGG